MCYWWFLEISWEQLQDCSFSVLLCRNCPLRSFLGIGLMLDISFWGSCGLRTMSWILFSEKLYLMTLCTSFVLYKVKKTFGGSRWKAEAQGAYTCMQILGLCQLLDFWLQALVTVPDCNTISAIVLHSTYRKVHLLCSIYMSHLCVTSVMCVSVSYCPNDPILWSYMA